jgi:hypothetical protein
MKRPIEINVYPLDVKKDEDGGLWFRVPSWIVRAYKLKNYGTNMGKVKFIIKSMNRAMVEYMGEEKGKSEYFLSNWNKKLLRENKKKITNRK